MRPRLNRCFSLGAVLAGLVFFSTGSAAAPAREPPFILPRPSELNKIRSAQIVTAKGKLRIELFPEDAPWHVANFKFRADKGMYRNTAFHIYFPNYIIQGGGPVSNPAYSASYTLEAEFNQHKHAIGALGMARKPDYANPERRSSGNQFHLILGDSPHMDGAFTVFGQVVGGLEVLDELEKGDVIEDIKVFVSAR